MKRLALTALLLVTGCSQGMIGGPEGPDVDTILIQSLELAGSTLEPRTVTAGDRSDDDGTIDREFLFGWSLADCAEESCLPVDLGQARSHVIRLRATDSSGDIVYKKVTITLYP